jgi:hypothetical protein
MKEQQIAAAQALVDRLLELASSAHGDASKRQDTNPEVSQFFRGVACGLGIAVDELDSMLDETLSGVSE